MYVFDWSDCGTIADIYYGTKHVRLILRQLLSECKEDNPALIEALKGDMSDDCWEEDEALELLQKHTDPECSWVRIDGDVFLVDNHKAS